MASEPTPQRKPQPGPEALARQRRGAAPPSERERQPEEQARQREAEARLDSLRNLASAETLARLDADLAAWGGTVPEWDTIPAEAATTGDPGTAVGAGEPEESPVGDGDGEREEINLTDPKAMRALAHPVRMALLELFGIGRTLTATQASEILGESPANCAFHLRTLAKYGFVREAGGGRGRERPWVRASRSINLDSRQEDPQAAMAAKALGQVWHERWLERIRHVFTSEAWPPGWEDATQSSRSVQFLTSDEAVRVAREMRAILDRYKDRQDNPALRPAGALPVEFVTFGYPLAELAGLSLPGTVPSEDAAAGEPDEPDEEPGPGPLTFRRS